MQNDDVQRSTLNVQRRKGEQAMKTLTKIAAAVIAGAGAAAALDSRRKRGDFSFRDRSVVITGGSRGLGLVLARQLAEEGAKVTILARDGAELDRAVRD